MKKFVGKKLRKSPCNQDFKRYEALMEAIHSTLEIYKAKIINERYEALTKAI